jgi:hypothetical protein
VRFRAPLQWFIKEQIMVHKSIFGVFLGKISSEGQAFTFKGVVNTGIFS